jgi:putative glycosyltransferase (TIGR04372 family)
MSRWRAWLKLPCGITEDVAEPMASLAIERVAARRGNLAIALTAYEALLRRYADQGTTAPPGRPRPTALLLEQIGQNPAAADGLRIEAATMLAEDLVNIDSDFTTAFDVLRHKATLQAQWQRRHGSSRDLLLGEEWTRNIGHIGLIQYVVKLKRLGLAAWDRIVVVSRPEVVANAALLRQYADEIAIETDPVRVAELAPFVCGTGLRIFDLLSWPGQKTIFAREACNVVEALWWAQHGDRPLLQPSGSLLAEGRALAGELGLPEEATFVCLHVREGGFHGDVAHHQRAFRIADYMTAVRAVTERGDWVVRLGDPSMSPLPPMPRVIDYARHPARTPALDVYLAARCRFYIGTNSGPMFMPHLFGRPALITNYMFLYGAPPLGPTSRVLPRLLKRGRRRIRFATMMADAYMKSTYNERAFNLRGLSSIDNTSQEILEAVLEMYAPEPSGTLQRRFAELAPAAHRGGDTRIGARFIADHADLL